MIILETERLILRHVTPNDADTLTALLTDPEVMRYIGDGRPKPAEFVQHVIRRALIDENRAWDEATRERLPQLRRSIERDAHFSMWAVVWKADGRMIGRCGLLAWDLDGAKEAEVGYWMAPEFWGRGLATEAARAVRDYGFERLGFGRLISIIHPDNVASQRVALKNGMTHERDTKLGEIPVRVYVVRRPVQ